MNYKKEKQKLESPDSARHDISSKCQIIFEASNFPSFVSVVWSAAGNKNEAFEVSLNETVNDIKDESIHTHKHANQMQRQRERFQEKKNKNQERERGKRREDEIKQTVEWRCVNNATPLSVRWRKNEIW